MFEHQLCIGNDIQEVTTPMTVNLVAAAVISGHRAGSVGGQVCVSTQESHTCSAIGSHLGQNKGDISSLSVDPPGREAS